MIASLPQWLLPLRSWQKDGLSRWLDAESSAGTEARRPAFLAVATPGAGKTMFATRLAHGLLRTQRVQKVFPIVPRLHLKRQMARAMDRAGIRIDWKWDGGKLPKDCHGAAVTYQQLAADPESIARHAGVAFAIPDEIHHASEEGVWGQALTAAVGHAPYKLALSGTPWRTDEERIPFINYDPDGHYMADVNYSYPDAVADGVCRPIAFAYADGAAQWIDADGLERNVLSAADAAQMGPERVREWLRTQQDFGMQRVMELAHERLLEKRRTVDPTSAGLITARDQEHAKRLAGMLYAITGDAPALVVSDAEDADRRLEEFSKGRGSWIVAVHMVSEGIDIPRLRVGIYASNVWTEMYFRQWKGRFVRAGDDRARGSAAELFVPKVPRIVEIVQNIEQEVRVGVKRRQQKLETVRTEPAPQVERINHYVGISGQLESQEGFVAGASRGNEEVEVVSWIDKREQLRKEVNELVNQLAKHTGASQQSIHGKLNQRFGDTVPSATDFTLQKRLANLKTQLVKYEIHSGSTR